MAFVKGRPEAPPHLDASLATAPWNHPQQSQVYAPPPRPPPLPQQPSWLQEGEFRPNGGLLMKAVPAPAPVPSGAAPQMAAQANPGPGGAMPGMAQGPTGLVNTLPISEYRKRIVEIYSVHRPDNVHKVDYLLQKYSGEEEFLYQSICQKYNIDPAVKWPGQSPAPAAPSLKQPPAPPPPPPRPCPPWATATTTQVKMPAPPAPPAPQTPAPGRMASGAPAASMVRPHIGAAPRPPGLLAAPQAKVIPPPPPPANTRAGLGYVTPGAVPASMQAPPVAPTPPAQPRKMRHEVMEWDPATGEMVATTVDIEMEDLQELIGASAVGPAVSSSTPPTANEQPLKPVRPPPGKAAGQPEDSYDPFSAEVAQPVRSQPRKQKFLDMVEIDYLLLGERSGFFEDGDKGGNGKAPSLAPGTVITAQPLADEGRAAVKEVPCAGPGRPDSQEVVQAAPVAISRASTSDSMEVEGAAAAPEKEPAPASTSDSMQVEGAAVAPEKDPDPASTSDAMQVEGAAAAPEKDPDPAPLSVPISSLESLDDVADQTMLSSEEVEGAMALSDLLGDDGEAASFDPYLAVEPEEPVVADDATGDAGDEAAVAVSGMGVGDGQFQ